ncbi:hypothetical protein FA95DRAFT_1017174 [Auriscalpium vulgare]|uniref:Uncharacterized protein n=1 Tax=Auriscalpium vulgare TaxID=40419 RepID=A0ACB8RXR8_9AGAM|nr:hypothetical protein FA95DRAFT_1017174 [Auriscalpium vulgare]
MSMSPRQYRCAFRLRGKLRSATETKHVSQLATHADRQSFRLGRPIRSIICPRSTPKHNPNIVQTPALHLHDAHGTRRRDMDARQYLSCLKVAYACRQPGSLTTVAEAACGGAGVSLFRLATSRGTDTYWTRTSLSVGRRGPRQGSKRAESEACAREQRTR